MYKQYFFVLSEYLKPYNPAPSSKRKDDVQILYSGPNEQTSDTGADVELGGVGHWVCIHYQAATRTIFVHDSLFLKHLSPHQMDVIKILYPKRKGEIIFVPPKYTQTEYISCGLFAIFHATTILLGLDIEHCDLALNYVNGDTTLYMRLHVLKMFANRQLDVFPSSEDIYRS